MPTVAIDTRDAHAAELRGWGQYARCLTEALARRDDGLDYRFLEGGGGPLEAAWEQVGLPLRLRREKAALVHSPNCFLPLRRPCPGVVTIHDLAFEEYPDDFTHRTGAKYRAFTLRSARSAERIICPSEFTKADVCERYGVDGEKVRVIPEAPALPITGAEPPPGPYLLAVGDLRRKKNLRALVEAHELLDTPHRLVLAGGDSGEGAHLVGEGVELAGYVDDARLDALMRGADVLVHPSLYEGFGLVLVEAMARGLPVACSATTALPETAGGGAVLFDPEDPEDIARGIREALERGPELAERGRARVAELSWDATAAATVSVYRELLP